MRTLTWLLLLPVCLSCGYAFMFSPLRDKAKEPGEGALRRHFRIRQNLPEHAQGWLGSKWLWLFFVVVLYVILKFRGDSEKSKVRTAPPRAHPGPSPGPATLGLPPWAPCSLLDRPQLHDTVSKLIEQSLANVFWKRPDSRCFELCSPHSLGCDSSTLPFGRESSLVQCASK
uniref:Protein FAM209B n=1 Tax=Canis lupus familiaris TaxID=9615 RepID=A0A8I3S5L3_CANLF